VVGDRYAELLRASGRMAITDPGAELAERLETLARAGGLPRSLNQTGIPRTDLSVLAKNATLEWTGNFNPQPLNAEAALALYEKAF